MKRLRLLLPLLISAFLLNACKKENAQPQAPANLVYDGDMETFPWHDWGSGYGYNLNDNSNKYAVDYSIEAASSPTHSIKVKCDTIRNDSTFHYLSQQFLGANISIGAKLTLKAKIKTVNLQGKGLSIAIRGDQKLTNGQTKQTFFTTTQGKMPIIGTTDFTEYTLTLDAFPANTDYVYIFLVYLPQTTGTAYYDDVSLTVN